MKSFKTILLRGCIFILISTAQLFAQNTARELRPLDAEDFKCLQSLECIKSSENLKAKGWSFIFDDTVQKFAQELTARMEGKNISFYAVYDKKGNLIRSEYKRKNIALPASLLAYLAENELTHAQLTGTEMVMKNFDASTISYKVMLESKSSVESKNFDIAFIDNIRMNSEGLAGN